MKTVLKKTDMIEKYLSAVSAIFYPFSIFKPLEKYYIKDQSIQSYHIQPEISSHNMFSP